MAEKKDTNQLGSGVQDTQTKGIQKELPEGSSMKYINTFQEGTQVKDVYLCKRAQSAMTKAGKHYMNVSLQDKTGMVDAKIWDPDSPGIGDFEEMDYVWVIGEVVIFNDKNQLNIRQIRRAGQREYDPADYMPTSRKPVNDMLDSLLGHIETVEAPYMKKLLYHFFVDDQRFCASFCSHSAAKSVHHGFIGGLLEHTLSVTGICSFFASNYPFLDRDLLITAAILHDIGKVKELSPFPRNDYTDEGQLLGHISIGAYMVWDVIRDIEDFPEIKAHELIHCMLSHHGELEFGSPKKPALVEALALSFADNVDAKMETMREALYQNPGNYSLKWQGVNKYIDSNIRRTSVSQPEEESWMSEDVAKKLAEAMLSAKK